jgi:tRNA(Arg) A34 adenosine deaminase TadA
MIEVHRRMLLWRGAAILGFAGAFAPRMAQAQTPPNAAAAFMARAFALRDQASAAGDQPYGAVVVRDGRIVGEGPSRVVTATDPTAHAEMEAIRDAARKLGSRNLSGCVIFASSRPCPMCQAGAYWAGIGQYYYGSDIADGGAPRLGC